VKALPLGLGAASAPKPQPLNLRSLRPSNEGSQMPRHLISDAHEWINEIPTVPVYYLAKPQPRERAWKNQRGKKTLLSLTLVRLCETS